MTALENQIQPPSQTLLLRRWKSHTPPPPSDQLLLPFAAQTCATICSRTSDGVGIKIPIPKHCFVPRRWPGHVAPPLLPRLIVHDSNKTNYRLRVPRFERHRSSRGELPFADDKFHFLTRSRRPRQTLPALFKHRALQKSRMGADELQTDAHKLWASIRGSTRRVAV